MKWSKPYIRPIGSLHGFRKTIRNLILDADYYETTARIQALLLRTQKVMLGDANFMVILKRYKDYRKEQ